MNPGPEIDALVATEVMGWIRINTTKSGRHFVWGYPEHPNPPPSAAGPDWSPSTNIAAAWEVVEKMDCPVAIGTCLAGWAVSFYPEGVSITTSRSASVSHAICLAALKAKGVEV